MNSTRRRWVQGLIGLGSLGFLWQRAARGQARAAAGSCSGTVSDPQGTGIKNLVVEIIEPNGRVATGNTDAQGSYKLSAPQSGPYVIQFREAQGNTRLLDVRELTAGTNQILSVTIDPQRKTVSAIYSALQAVEALAALMMADRAEKAAPMLMERIPLRELRSITDSVINEINRSEPTPRQRAFLVAKAAAVKGILDMFANA
jgi:hypothetical protein